MISVEKFIYISMEYLKFGETKGSINEIMRLKNLKFGEIMSEIMRF